MARAAISEAVTAPIQEQATRAILDALPLPVVVVAPAAEIAFVNMAAEQFFGVGANHLDGRGLSEFIPQDSPIFDLIDHVRATGATVAEYEITLESPRIKGRPVTIQVAPMGDSANNIVFVIQEQSIARRIGRQLGHRGAARSITAMAAMLAHEVKNPLSGIRGAAQLLEGELDEGGRRLTTLICNETDRICALLDRMDVFDLPIPADRDSTNIYRVLEYARQVAESGFARHVRFTESYDPSLPAVLGNRDLLIQVFLNLIKNAAEAVPKVGGEIGLATAYRHGVRLAVPGRGSRVHLPLLVTVSDNGSGIPPDFGDHLFDPFITTKPGGTGLGLALVGKIINDHGGVVEYTSEPGKTVFKIMLPVHPDGTVDE
ncbi:MAG: PAS domain-containing protein [Alphaproteobacteria bacterium]|nr:PAS domain-containing protein [Alphaproteobacteria bacterium]